MGRELGRTPSGDPLFMWKWSDDLYHMMPSGDYDYVAQPGSTIVLPRAILERRLAAPHLRRQWVLCKWTPPDMPLNEWLQSFGTRYEWPRHGTWCPTNIALPQGLTPGDLVRGQSFNDRLIGIMREQLAKTLKQLHDEAADASAAKELAADQTINDMVNDAMPKVGRFVPPASTSPAIAL